MAFLTEMAGQNGHEVGIALRGEHRERVPERPDHQPGDPLLQPQTKRGGDRPVDDRDCTRGAPEQNRLGKRPVQRSLEPLDMRSEEPTSALQSLMRLSSAGFCVKKKNTTCLDHACITTLT